MFSEAAVRLQFIDPFFAVLGWDMNNAQGFAELYNEVVHEDKVGGQDQSPGLLLPYRQGSQVLRRGQEAPR